VAVSCQAQASHSRIVLRHDLLVHGTEGEEERGLWGNKEIGEERKHGRKMMKELKKEEW
jgi:hypothetical protein